MSDLKCSNEECESRTNDSQPPFFNVSVTVYENRSLAMSLHKLDVEQFTCGMCDAKAEADCNYCKDDPDGTGAWCVCGRELAPKEEAMKDGDPCPECGTGTVGLIKETPLKSGLAAFGCSAKLQCDSCDSTWIPKEKGKDA